MDATKSTAINGTVTLTANDFGYMFSSRNVAMRRVRVMELPENGTLQLLDEGNNASNVTAGQDISRAEIDAGRFRFIPDVGEFGEPYARFAFRVRGEAFSAGIRWMTFNVTAATNNLVSNLKQSPERAVSVSTPRAQTFTTGYYTSGYSVGKVQVISRDTHGDALYLSICGTDSQGLPNTTCKALNPPDRFAAGMLTYTAPPEFHLASRTTYAVTMRSTGEAHVAMSGADSTGEDDDSLFGWSVGDFFHSRPSTTWEATTPGKAFRIAIEGIRSAPSTETAPRASDGAVRTVEDGTHTFTAADFNFTAVSPGDTLSKVHIVTLPEVGTLTLDGTAVTAGQEITVANINDMQLTFTPVMGEFGENYASFVFRVEGGTEVSDDVYRMTINVDPGDSDPPELDDTTEPVLAADGRTLTNTFSEPMSETSTPDASTFTVKATPAGGTEATDLAAMATVTVEGNTVVLVLAKPIAHNDTDVKVSYAKPESGATLQDLAGNDLASFGDQDVVNGSLIPRVRIEALEDDVTPVIALPHFRFTASAAPSTDLELNLELTEMPEQYVELDTVTITATDTVEEAKTVSFRDTINTVNTDGTVTVTVVGGDDHLPALPPKESATVAVKLPPTGPSVWVSHESLSYSVTEGDTFSVGVVFNAGEGVARPRDGLKVAFLTADDGNATINKDYVHVSANIPVAAADWSVTGAGGYTHTHRQNITIEDDDLYEPEEETFVAYMQAAQGESNKLVIPGRNDSGGEATITITDNDTLGSRTWR